MFVRGGVEDLESIERKVEILNAISELFGGKSDAVSVAQAIENISEVVQPPTLIEKTVTSNGEYSASDDDASGYSKVTVNVVSENNGLFGADPTYNFGVLRSIVEVDIPTGVETIGSQAFNGASKLTRVTIPQTVSGLGSGAFMGCSSLTSITIPRSVNAISSNSFQGCTALETITINKAEGSIEGAPWGAPETCQVIWTG